MKESSADRASILRCTGASSMFCSPVRSALLFPSCTCSGWVQPEGRCGPSFPRGGGGGEGIGLLHASLQGGPATAPPAVRLVSETEDLTPRCYRDCRSHLGTERNRGRAIDPRSRGRAGETSRSLQPKQARPALASPLPEGQRAAASCWTPGCGGSGGRTGAGTSSGTSRGTAGPPRRAGRWGAACTWGRGVGCGAVSAVTL